MRNVRLLLACIFAVLVGTASGHAAVQRMAIAADKYPIAAKSSKTIQAFCLDETREGPSSNSNFKNVLTEPGQTRVTIGSRTVTLQEALDTNIVAIKGARNGGLSLELVNLTDQSISIDLQKNTAVGEEQESADDIQSILWRKDLRKGNHFDIQLDLWDAANSRNKELFANQGFRTEDDDLEPVIKQFQAANFLPDTKQIDPATRLHLADAEALRLLNQNKQNNYLAIKVRTRDASGNKTPFRATLGGVDGVVNGETPSELYQSIGAVARNRGADRVYVMFDGSTSINERVAFAASLRNLSRANVNGPDFFVRSITEYVSVRSDDFFARGISRISGIDGTEIGAGDPRPVEWEGASGFEKEFEIAVGSKRPTPVSVRSRAVEVLRGVFNRLSYWVAPDRAAALQRMSPADLVALTMRQTAQDLNMSPAEMKEAVQVQFGQRQVADVSPVHGLLNDSGG